MAEAAAVDAEILLVASDSMMMMMTFSEADSVEVASAVISLAAAVVVAEACSSRCRWVEWEEWVAWEAPQCLPRPTCKTANV